MEKEFADYCHHGVPLTGKCSACLRAIKKSTNRKKTFMNRMIDPDRGDRNFK